MNALPRLSHATLALVALAAAAAPVRAQEISPAKLWLELEQTLPKRGPVAAGKEGARMPGLTEPVRWPQTLEPLAVYMGRAQGSPVEPYAMYYLATAQFNAGAVEEATALLEALKETFPQHPLNRLKLAQNGARTHVEAALDECRAEAAWVKRYPRPVMAEPAINPDLNVVFTFPQGEVTFGFYDNVAPATVAQFVKNVAEGVYADTIVGRIVAESTVALGHKPAEKGRMIPSERGSSTPPIPLEVSAAVHERGALSMMRNLGQPESHGVLFEVLLKTDRSMDFTRTVFGRVISGIEVLDAVSRSTPDQYQYPAQNVPVKKAVVLRGQAKSADAPDKR